MSVLSELAVKHGTDKWGHHYYTEIYHSYFHKYRYLKVNLLEIGIGGYEYPDRGGASLKMWEEYFEHGKITGIDLHAKHGLDTERIKTHIGSQDDPEFLNKLIDEIGAPDIIVDDGSHISELTIKTFEILFPRLKSGGIYVVEDAGTSYWKDHFFGDNDVNNYHSHTTMNYFRKLIDQMYQDRIPGKAINPEFKDQVLSIHFYFNLIFILKA